MRTPDFSLRNSVLGDDRFDLSRCQVGKKERKGSSLVQLEMHISISWNYELYHYDMYGISYVQSMASRDLTSNFQLLGLLIKGIMSSEMMMMMMMMMMVVVVVVNWIKCHGLGDR